MNTKLLLLTAIVISVSSCSTAYKTTQTPDDVYYSPARFYDEESSEDKQTDKADQARSVAEERQIRLGINDRRWRYFDDDYYSYSPYLYGYDYGYYYNPYYCSMPVYSPVILAPVNPKVTTPRMTNLAAYNNSYNNSNSTGSVKMSYVNNPVRTYNNSNSSTKSSRVANTLNKVFNITGNDNNNSSNSRSYNPGSGSSSSSSSSGGSISRPARNGRN